MHTTWDERPNRSFFQARIVPEIAEDVHKSYTGITCSNQPSSDPISAEAFIADTSSSPNNSAKNVAAHEVGHALGIERESADSVDVMYEIGTFGDPCNVKRRDWNDVNRL